MKSHIARVVIPLEATADLAAAIDTAARLAGAWQVPLHAVFVEEEDLHHLAGLPFARQVSLTAGSEILQGTHIAAHFRAFAERMRAAVAAAAGRHRVPEWSDVTVHGTLAAAELRRDDFVVSTAVTRPIGRHFRLPRRSRRPSDSPRSLLRVRRDWHEKGAVLAILRRRDAAAARLLDLAAEIAGFAGQRLVVLAAPDAEGAAAFAAWVADLLAGRRLQLTAEMAPLDPAALRHRLVHLDCSLVAIADDHAEFEAAFAECDVLTLGASR